MSPWNQASNNPVYEREREARDAAHTETRCLFCSWTHVGTAAEGRVKAEAHRLTKHPDATNTFRRRQANPARGRSPAMSRDHMEDVENERRKRMYLLGIAEVE